QLRDEPGGGGESRLRGPHPAASRRRAEPAVRRGQQAPTVGGGANPQLAEPVAAAAGALGEEGGELPRHAPPGLRPAHLQQTGSAFGAQGGTAYLIRHRTRGIGSKPPGGAARIPGQRMSTIARAYSTGS